MQQLSPDELLQVREWLENWLEDQQPMKPEFLKGIEQSELELASGIKPRVRRPQR